MNYSFLGFVALITSTARASTAPDATPGAGTMANARCCAQQGLTLERTPSGWIQRAAFTHPDLHDDLVEELVPLSSPFSSMCVRGSSAFTFLLLGDQNAGKSTFLHAFSHTGDATWLEIGSYLPIISASFVNASLSTDSAAPPVRVRVRGEGEGESEDRVRPPPSVPST